MTEVKDAETMICQHKFQSFGSLATDWTVKKRFWWKVWENTSFSRQECYRCGKRINSVLHRRNAVVQPGWIIRQLRRWL